MVAEVRFEIRYDWQALSAKLKEAGRKAMTGAARLVSVIAKRSIKRRGRARSSARRSSPGRPFFSVTGNAKKSIKLKVNRSGTTAWIGGTRPGGAHMSLLEHGTRRMMPRPVMQLARQKALDAIPRKYANTF